MPKSPHIISGNIHTDPRGRLLFFNDFDMSNIKRFYQITNNDTQLTNNKTVRAWQGHKIEEKYFYVAKGKYLICLVEIDNWQKPSKDLEVKEFVLIAESPDILHVPAGYANGVKALEQDSILMVFSNLSLNESKKDDYRFNPALWLDWDKV